MSLRVCLGANTHGLPHAGGHLWAYLGWALGLRACGVDVVWLEELEDAARREAVEGLRRRLARFGLADSLAVGTRSGAPLPASVAGDCLGPDDAAECDLLLDVGAKIAPRTVARFRRSALVDIDPGLLQLWIDAGRVPFPAHDVHFTIGETVGTSDAGFPDCGLEWRYTPPPVDLVEWPPTAAAQGAPYTTVSSWWGWWDEHEGELRDNSKRAGFSELVDLPARAPVPLELALALWGRDDHSDVARLREAGWTVRDAFRVAATPDAYREYVRGSRAELGFAKPSCSWLQNAWVSDRSLCYLASGRPAIVPHTGPSRFLPDAAGLFRFHDAEGALHAIEAVESEYERHAREARALAEEHFDARRVVGRVLEVALS